MATKLTITPDVPPAPEVDTSRLEQTSENRVVVKTDAVPPAAPETEPTKKYAEKYETVEQLEKAYVELQSKLGAPKPETKPEAPASTPTPSGGTDLDAATKEITETGALSDATKAKLSASGIPAAMIDAFVSAKQAEVSTYVSAIESHVGGKAQLDAMFAWARTNMPEAETLAVDAAIKSGNVNLAKVALSGLAARYESVNGRAPRLLSSSESTTPAGTQPFRSNAEVTAAINNPKYTKDSAYRAEVERRLAVTDL